MMQVGHFYPYQAPQKSYIDGRMKERQSQKPLVRNSYTINRPSVSFEELHFALQNFLKTLEKWSIKETNDK